MTQGTSGVNARAYSKTLGNGLLVLELLRHHRQGLGINAIATELGLHRTVVYRLIGTLRAHNLVTVGADGHHRVGLGLLELATAVRADLRRAAEPHLTRLAEHVAATAFLAVADQDDAVSACVVEPGNARLHVGYRLGIRHPLTVSAAGLAILAGRPAVEGERTEVTRARTRGYATTTAELEPGAWGLATRLPNASGHAGASIGVVALSQLDATTIAPTLREIAATIAEEVDT
ncbi:IclR family transcriptional regulator [Allosaccharopolyspora coralli]|uniref:IclR family transcriptional regulator n=1 Tax=Allosaccharopolyspora coralli TaxID=2665642 RepID=UPI001651B195|nr:helix-turn-helix domain-containing protein [Allosaccharopolyspora coralli]